MHQYAYIYMYAITYTHMRTYRCALNVCPVCFVFLWAVLLVHLLVEVLCLITQTPTLNVGVCVIRQNFNQQMNTNCMFVYYITKQ